MGEKHADFFSSENHSDSRGESAKCTSVLSQCPMKWLPIVSRSFKAEAWRALLAGRNKPLRRCRRRRRGRMPKEEGER
eukprot:5143899-Amphidinium_carterae.1